MSSASALKSRFEAFLPSSSAERSDAEKTRIDLSEINVKLEMLKLSFDDNALVYGSQRIPLYDETEDLTTSQATDMTNPSREELDAKFERTEARVDARLADFQRVNSEALGEIRTELKAIHADLGNLKSLKWQIWTSMAAAVALVFAIVTYGASTFESGRNTAVVVRDAQQKIEETATVMKKQQEDTQRLLQEAIKAITQTQSAKP